MTNALPPLDLDILLEEATEFARAESEVWTPKLFGTTDGKAVGTYLEQRFTGQIYEKYDALRGNSTKGIDLPSLDVDIKVTSIAQPQSSSPFRFARQKVFGLGYHLLLFVYEKTDDPGTGTANLRILHLVFIHKHRTADYTLTKVVRQMRQAGTNAEDIAGYLFERNLPVDEIEVRKIAEELLEDEPPQGYVTISNALQWRLQYGHAIREAGAVEGVVRL